MREIKNIMERDTTIILQGPLSTNPYINLSTVSIAKTYADLWFVDHVIISTWEDEEILEINDPRITVIRNEKVKPHLNNLNLQIKSSREGVKLSNTKYTVKMRSDQFIYPSTMGMMREFVLTNINKKTLSYSDGTSPEGYVFVNGIDDNNPYLVQDHIFWGYTKDINNIFSCDYLMQEVWNYPPDGEDESYWDDKFNQPSWFGLHYMKQFDNRVLEHSNNHELYLYNKSEKRDAAMKVYREIRDKIFMSFPKLDMLWIKRYPIDNGKYPFDMYLRQNYYWYEELVENTIGKYDPEKGFSKYY